MTFIEIDDRSDEPPGAEFTEINGVKVVDIPADRSIGGTFTGYQFFLLFLLVAAFMLVSVAFGAGLRLNPTISVLAGVIIVLPIAYLVSRQLKSTPESLSKSIKKLGRLGAIQEAMKKPLNMNTHKGVSLGVGAVAADGERGVVYRFLRSSDLRTIEPIEVPFEPTVPDESDARITEMLSETSDAPKREPTAPMIRNIRRAGGWVIVAIFGFNLFIQVVRALVQWQVSWELLVWAGLVAMIFGVGRTWRVPTFFAVPGGIVSHKLRGVRREPVVDLFTAADSVLCVYWVRKQMWVMAMANKQSAKWTVVTPTEGRFALAAWLSPLGPPTPEQLSEL